jgi:hypothetical protein
VVNAMTLEEWATAYILQFGPSQVSNMWTKEENEFLARMQKEKKLSKVHAFEAIVDTIDRWGLDKGWEEP